MKKLLAAVFAVALCGAIASAGVITDPLFMPKQGTIISDTTGWYGVYSAKGEPSKPKQYSIYQTVTYSFTDMFQAGAGIGYSRIKNPHNHTESGWENPYFFAKFRAMENDGVIFDLGAFYSPDPMKSPFISKGNKGVVLMPFDMYELNATLGLKKEEFSLGATIAGQAWRQREMEKTFWNIELGAFALYNFAPELAAGLDFNYTFLDVSDELKAKESIYLLSVGPRLDFSFTETMGITAFYKYQKVKVFMELDANIVGLTFRAMF